MNEQITDGGPAFPQPMVDNQGRVDSSLDYGQGGLSVRDYFAAKAIGLFVLSDDNVKALAQGQKPRHDVVAQFCYELADALLAERSKPIQRVGEGG